MTNPSVPLMFKNSILILAAAIILLPQLSMGQDTVRTSASENHFRVSLGLEYIKTTDSKVSPHMYQSLRNTIQLAYENKLKNGVLFTRLDIFMGALNPSDKKSREIFYEEKDIYGNVEYKSHNLKLMQIGGAFELGYLATVKKSINKAVTWHVGGSLSESMTFVPGFLNVGLINHVSANAKLLADFTLKNGKPVWLGLTFPVVSLVTRLPYHNAPVYPDKSILGGFFKGNSNLESLNHFQSIQLSARYQWLVRKRIAMDVVYMASWLHYKQSEHLTQAGSQLSIGLNF